MFGGLRNVFISADNNKSAYSQFLNDNLARVVDLIFYWMQKFLTSAVLFMGEELK